MVPELLTDQPSGSFSSFFPPQITLGIRSVLPEIVKPDLLAEPQELDFPVLFDNYKPVALRQTGNP